jgi:hypothetical protein
MICAPILVSVLYFAYSFDDRLVLVFLFTGFIKPKQLKEWSRAIESLSSLLIDS